MEYSSSYHSQRSPRRTRRPPTGNRRTSAPHYPRQYAKESTDSGYGQEGRDKGRRSAARRNLASQRQYDQKQSTNWYRGPIPTLRRAGSMDDILDDNKDLFEASSMPNSPIKSTYRKGKKWSNTNETSLKTQSAKLSKSTENLLSDSRDKTRKSSQTRMKSPMRVKLRDREQETENISQPATGRKKEMRGDSKGLENDPQPALRRKAESLRRQMAVLNSLSTTIDPEFSGTITEGTDTYPRQPPSSNYVVHDPGFSFLYPPEIGEDGSDLSRLHMKELYKVVLHNTMVMERRLSRIEENQAFLTWKYQSLVRVITVYDFTSYSTSVDSYFSTCWRLSHQPFRALGITIA